MYYITNIYIALNGVLCVYLYGIRDEELFTDNYNVPVNKLSLRKDIQ